jgi:hypothetical protein
LFLLAGAIVNVVVAWGCSLYSHIWPAIELVGLDDADAEWIERLDLCPPTSANQVWGCLAPGRYAEYRWGRGYHSDESPLGMREVHVSTVCAGWPLMSCFGRVYGDQQVLANMSPRSLWNLKHSPLVKLPGHPYLAVCLPESWIARNPTLHGRFLPLQPIWPGFAINTIFYAAILWLLFAVAGSIRRWRRRRRGLCPGCAYPVGASDVCSECGGKLKVADS